MPDLPPTPPHGLSPDTPCYNNPPLPTLNSTFQQRGGISEAKR